jgi:hypothetical protein
VFLSLIRGKDKRILERESTGERLGKGDLEFARWGRCDLTRHCEDVKSL